VTRDKRRIERGLPAAVLAVALALPAGAPAAPVPAGEDARIVHVLNRLGYGPRPGDVEVVRRLGVSAWIDRQLRPEPIADAELTTRLAHLPTLHLSVAELYDGYEIPREARRAIQERRTALEGASETERMQARRELIAKYGAGMKGAPRQVVDELQQAKLLRAVYSERQLDEVLADFWLNHFNVFAAKGPEEFLVGAYERDVIRPHAWGRFEDLLVATARSPAMLFYLDNWLSADPDASMRFGSGRLRGRRPPMSQQPPPAMRRRGLNENYAREVMELHTVGVDGGYTQKDVTEVARALTGWTMTGLREGDPRFRFEPRLHVRGDKVVLGRTIRGGGIEEGEQVLHLLATHPSTARFISYKLARRFVADEPPEALVARAAETFRRTDGSIRAVVETIVKSPEFLGPEYRAAKVKTPLEFVASAVRASGAEVTSARALARRIAEMGMPLYLQPPPTGYKDTADAWVSTSGLLARLNLALDLAGGRLPGVRVDAARLPSAASLVPGGLSEATRRTVAAEGGAEPARVAGLVLGSPEFQRR
jgi:uncharacterized protein (DUF1800 family)